MLARDEAGAIQGVLHFVPCLRAPGRVAVVHAPRPGTPNGLTEFLVVKAVELLARARAGRDVAQLRHLRQVDAQPREAAGSGWLGKLVALGNPFFQIESLYRFNAKFFPRWEPRYLVYEGAFGLPRAGLAALWAEGQLSKPSLAPTGTQTLPA